MVSVATLKALPLVRPTACWLHNSSFSCSFNPERRAPLVHLHFHSFLITSASNNITFYVRGNRNRSSDIFFNWLSFVIFKMLCSCGTVLHVFLSLKSFVSRDTINGSILKKNTFRCTHVYRIPSLNVFDM